MRLPRTILELGRIFSTEKKCQEYMFKVRWPTGFVCPRCGSNKHYWINTRAILKCSDCGKQVSLKVGTVMEKSKRPLSDWFVAAYLMTTNRQGISAANLLEQTDIRAYECAWNVLHKLRAAAGQREIQTLSGMVEVDECYVGAEKPGGIGRRVKGKAIVVGAVEISGQGSGRCQLRVIPNLKKKTLHRFIFDRILPGSTVNTDGWAGYPGIENHGYYHDIVVTHTDPQKTEEWLPRVHRVFGNLKLWLNGTHHGVSPKHLQAYLNEFTFRFNRRKNLKGAFGVLLGLVAENRGPTYEALYRAGRRRGWKHPNPIDV